MKKSTNKIISFILAGTMAATLSGCSRNTNKDIKGVTIESSTEFSCDDMKPIDYCLDSFNKSYKENEKM